MKGGGKYEEAIREVANKQRHLRSKLGLRSIWYVYVCVDSFL